MNKVIPTRMEKYFKEYFKGWFLYGIILLFFDNLSLFGNFFYSRRNPTVGSTGSKAFGDVNLWMSYCMKYV
jgi:hypothetical protein